MQMSRRLYWYAQYSLFHKHFCLSLFVACVALAEIDRENISDNSTPSGEGQNTLGPIVSEFLDASTHL